MNLFEVLNFMKISCLIIVCILSKSPLKKRCLRLKSHKTKTNEIHTSLLLIDNEPLSVLESRDLDRLGRELGRQPGHGACVVEVHVSAEHPVERHVPHRVGLLGTVCEEAALVERELGFVCGSETKAVIVK